MLPLFGAAPQTIVIERGGTPWWVPFVTTLLVALVAAVVSYYVTWRFKKVDFDRENGVRAADHVDEAERGVTHGTIDSESAMRLLRQARVRAQRRAVA